MNSNYGKTSTSLNNFDFDFGIGNNRSRSLNDQKNKSNSSLFSSSSTSSSAKSNPMTTTPSWQPNKPSWTHQPAPSRTTMVRTELGGPTSMAGDIFGKSWNSTASSGPGVSIAVVNKDPNLFGDLVSSALGQNKNSSNAPLKSSTTTFKSVSSPFSMGGVADSLPKTNSHSVTSSNVSGGASQKFGNYVSTTSHNNSNYDNRSMNKSANLGGPSMSSLGGGVGTTGVGKGLSKDPFGSLVDFGSKTSAGATLNSTSKVASASSEDFAFGEFQDTWNSSTSTMSSNAFSSTHHKQMGSNSASVPKVDPPSQVHGESSGVDSFDMFFPSSTISSSTGAAASNGLGNQPFSGGDDWGLHSEFEGAADDLGGTTELEGLPAPPAGISALSAKTKGLDYHKQGQFADAIKWLSWAVVLLERAGDISGTMEVLICRATCYKEVGEYKKAVSDCTKVLDHDGTNVSVLVQRALFYESMEKYKLGAEDLRTVMKLDPGNKVAKSTIHRLTKMAE